MKRRHPLLGRFVLRFLPVLALLSVPAAASAQELYTYSLGLLGSVGGSLDADPGDDLGNTGYQLNLGMVTEPRTLVGFRIGHLPLDGEEQFGSLREAELEYVTLGGEYRLQQSYYDSGLFFALGGYRLQGLQGIAPDEREESETSIGLSIGVSGEFRVTRWLGVLVELSGHYIDFDEAQLFGLANGGIVLHF